ncbi:MAG: cyclic nucleotide-binding/CBS domain-containing protein [Nitrososphaerales archaeon]
MILVRDAMVSDVVLVDIETTLKETCRVMGEKHIGSVLITRNGKMEGIFTERDLLSKVILKGVDMEKSRVGDYMATPLTVIRSDYELKEAARAMAQLRVRRLPVIDNGRLVGIVTSADIVKAIAEAPLEI